MSRTELSTVEQSESELLPVFVWLVRILLPMVIIGVAIVVGRMILSGEEPAKRRAPPRPQPVVEVFKAEPIDYTIKISSQGTVEARTTGTLQPEVAGKVVNISSSFRDGGFFIAGETLLQIDDREYRAQLAISRAEIARSQLALNQERTLGSQARNDFKRLGSSSGNTKPSTLALRKPQLEVAQADLAAAKARLEIAELAIERSTILAPYNGRIISKNVDVGQYVTPSTMLASIYATDAVEVRLPLADAKLRYLQLPERVGDPQPPVTLSATVAGKKQSWSARLIRTEGSIDATSRQRVAIAQIVDPFAEAGRSKTPIKIGQFVEAQISGETLSNVVVLPTTAIQGREQGRSSVFVLDDEQQLQRESVVLLWQGGESAVVEAGALNGQQVVVTAPPFGTEGMKVRLPGQLDKRPEAESAKRKGAGTDRPEGSAAENNRPDSRASRTPATKS